MSEQRVFGLNAVRESLRAGGRTNRVYIAKGTKVRGRGEIIDLASGAGVPVEWAPLAKLNELAGSTEHQGVVATISPVEYTPLDTCLAQCPPQATLLVLDQVQHPKNLGMLIRTALAAGASGLLVPARGGALLDDAVMRASTGSLLHLPVVRCNNIAQTLRQLREEGFWIYGLAGDGAEDVFHIQWPDRAVLVAGNESEGLRPGVRKACDVLARISLANDVESLNVSVATAVALFQIKASRDGGG